MAGVELVWEEEKNHKKTPHFAFLRPYNLTQLLTDKESLPYLLQHGCNGIHSLGDGRSLASYQTLTLRGQREADVCNTQVDIAVLDGSEGPGMVNTN